MEITVLSAHNATLTKTLTKTQTGFAKQSYGSATYFDIVSQPADSIEELSELLTALEEMPTMCLVRGRRKMGQPLEGVRRLIHDAPDARAAFEDCAAKWLMIDVDDLPCDPDITNDERLAYITEHLPPCFRNASFHYQWSSSAGLDGWDLLRCHLFFWLHIPITSSFLRQQATAEGWMTDLSLFNPVQVHYTASPIFVGAADPLQGYRSGLVKKARSAVQLPAWTPPPPRLNAIGKRVYPAAPTFTQRLEAIGPDYHMPILQAAASYVGTLGRNADRDHLEDRLRHAIWNGAPGKNRKEDYLNKRYLDRVIDGALRKYGA